MTLPSPHISDETENFSVISGEAGVDDILEYDGLVRENKPSFRRTSITEIMCALEPEPDAHLPDHHGVDRTEKRQEDAAQPHDQPSFEAVNPDLKEAESISPGLTVAEARELPS